jgi:hypothetical protein
MKKITLVLSLLSITFLNGCMSRSIPTSSGNDFGYSTAQPQSDSPVYPSASAAPTSAPQIQKDLSSLRAGVLPDASLADAEKKLAGMLIRTTKPIFPLKIGVLTL